MKQYFIITSLLFVAFKAFCQLPENDGTWSLNWYDEFNYTGNPDPAKWQMSYPWGPVRSDDDLVIVRDDGNNTIVDNGYLSLLGKKDHYLAKVHVLDMQGNPTIMSIIFPFTNGVVSSIPKLGYGFYDMKILLPYDYHKDLYGGYFDNGFWQYDVSKTNDLDASEFDFEITTGSTDDPIFQGDNRFTFNAHEESPYGTRAARTALGLCTGPWCDDEHFMLEKVDRNDWVDYYTSTIDGSTKNRTSTYYLQRYQSEFLYFGAFDNPVWHRFSYEWSPDQVKYYLDGKLWFKLEGDFVYSYLDHNGNAQSTQPIHLLNLPMKAIFNLTLQGNMANYNSLSYPDLAMKIDYFRYYKMISACGTDVIESGSPAYDLCKNNYIEQVYENVHFGSSGCSSCSVTVAGGTGCLRKSVHAKSIVFDDGFSVSREAEFYACDVNCDAL